MRADTFNKMDLKRFTSSIYLIAEDKKISPEKVIEIIEQALAAAYKKDYGEKGQIIKAKLDPKTGKVKFWRVIKVVDKSMIYSEEELKKLEESKNEPQLHTESPSSPELDQEHTKVKFNPEKHIMYDEAVKEYPEIKVGDEIKIPLKDEESFGRIAAQTAKQVVLQRIKEAEREAIFDEYKKKEGDIVSGIVQRIERRNVFFDLGKTFGILTKEEQIPGEFYRPGQRLKTYVLKVEESSHGPVIYLSRSYPKLVSKLFELEVPEISSGQVVIKSIAREAGSRSKVAVASTAEGIDPIGAMVGQRGTRILAVINELGGEKIDVIEWSDDPAKYIANSLSPAKVLEVKILPKNKAMAIVADDQLSLAIGKDGQNVRLAVKLTGWKIDVKSEDQLKKESLQEGAVDEENESREVEGEKKEEEENKEEEKQVDEVKTQSKTKKSKDKK